jgi:hypothetical protein
MYKVLALFVECRMCVYSKFDVIKHMLSMPILNGRIGKWILALSEFELNLNRQKLSRDKLLLISLLNIMIHQLICLRLLIGLCSLMGPHVAKVVE